MRARADAFRTALERARLDVSLGILSRAVTDEMPNVQTAFYVADLDVTRLRPIRGTNDAIDSCGGSWSFPIETPEGKSVGVFEMYLPEARETTVAERELIDAITHDAAVIISHYTADRQRADTEAKAQQKAIFKVEGLVRQRTDERDEFRRQLVRVEESERRRLSRELHDQLGQDLTAFRLLLEDVARLVRVSKRRVGKPEATLSRRIEQLRNLAQKMMRGAKYVSLELRPPELDDVGLASALDTYLREWSDRYGVAAELSVTGSGSLRALSDDAASAFYRIAQEALTNVAKHAHARQVSVVVDAQKENVRMLIEDDGRGFDTNAPQIARHDRGYGVAGMRERAALAGVRLEIESGADGTTVYVQAPIR